LAQRLPPKRKLWDRLLQNGPQGCTLKVLGKVAHPKELTIDELRKIGFREQITEHYCIQGWSGIAKWGGTPMAKLLEVVKPLPSAKYVVFFSHQLTLLAYEMNAQPSTFITARPSASGARTNSGSKQVKWIEAIEFVEDYTHLGARQGGYNEDHEFYSWRSPI
jgi:DMSO/TMAO reductase YedYZ molybdopterin-dependent catalytic subunit